MNKYFLGAKEQQKLDIFRFILFSKSGYTNQELINHFELNTTTYRRYINEIRVELLDFFHGKVNIMINEGKIEVERDPQINIDVIMLTLQNFYTKQNSLYIIITSLLKKKYSSVTEISQELNFSEPMVYKNLSEVNKMLSSFGAELNINSNAESNFLGDELGIRYFIYLMYWNLYSTLSENPFSRNFPIEFTDMDFLIKHLKIKENLSHSQKTKLKMMSGITSYRIVYFNRTIVSDSNFLEDIDYFYSGTPCLNIKKFNVSPEILEKESIIFSYLVRGIIYDIDTYTEKRYIVEKYLDSDLKISYEVKESLKLFKDLLKEDYSEEEYIEFFYIFLLTFIYFKYHHFDNDSFLVHPIQDNLEHFEEKNKYKELFFDLEKIAQNLSFFNEINPVDKKSLIFFLFVMYEMKSIPKPISIYVTLTSDVAVIKLIKTNILKVFNKEIVTFCDSPTDADIVISDTFEGYNNSNFFLFYSVYDKDIWKNLLEFISHFVAVKLSSESK